MQKYRHRKVLKRDFKMKIAISEDQGYWFLITMNLTSREPQEAIIK